MTSIAAHSRLRNERGIKEGKAKYKMYREVKKVRSNVIQALTLPSLCQGTNLVHRETNAEDDSTYIGVMN